jgi:hypothetical protein
MTTGATIGTPASHAPKFPPQPSDRDKAWRAGVLGAVNVLVMILAVRAILALAVIGAIILAWVTIRDPDPLRLGALAVYAVTVLFPVAWLAARR